MSSENYPSEQLLRAVEAIATIQETLSPEDLSLLSKRDLHIRSTVLTSDTTEYVVWGTVVEYLIFVKKRDGSRVVNKYLKAHWEDKIYEMLTLCRQLGAKHETGEYQRPELGSSSEPTVSKPTSINTSGQGKTAVSIGAFLPEEEVKIDRLYYMHIYQALGGRYPDITNRDDIERASKLALQALEKATDEEPGEFIWNFVLGDHYGRLGRLADATRACQRAVNIKPDDPRAHYAMATVYRMLMRAIYAEPQYRERIDLVKEMQEGSSMGAMTPQFDPDSAASALQELHMTWQDAAKVSVKYFRSALALGFSRSENMMIEQTIEEIRSQCLRHGLSV